MPGPSALYNTAVAEARRRLYERLQPQVFGELYALLARALIDLDRDFDRGEITEERRRELAKSIEKTLSRYAAEVKAVMGDGALASAELAVSGHATGLQAASTAAGIRVTASFNEVPRRALEASFARRGIGRTFKTFEKRALSAHLRQEAETYLQSAITRGVSAGRAAAELARIIAQDDPELLRALDKAGVNGGKLSTRVRRLIHQGSYDELLALTGMEPGEMAKTRRLLSDARRVALNETLSAFHEGDRTASAISPVVAAVRWERSGRHRSTMPRGCSCDLLAEMDLHGMGKGRYRPETVPARPHAHCMCVLSKELRPASEWGKPRGPLPEPKEPAEADVRRVLPEGATDAHVRAQREAVAKHLRLADAVARR